MAKIEMYVKSWCGYCWRAKRLLKSKDVEFELIDVSSDPEAERVMIERSGGGYTVPQIFIDGVSIGGSDELVAADQAGKLDEWLAGKGLNEEQSDVG